MGANSCRRTFDRVIFQATDRQAARDRHPQPLTGGGREASKPRERPTGTRSARPRSVGTGSVFLDSTLGGYHVFQITPGERWILDTRCFWASDGEVNLRIQRERMLTAFFAGEGLLWYKTALSGDGQVVLVVDGPRREDRTQGQQADRGRPLRRGPHDGHPPQDEVADQVILELVALGVEADVVTRGNGQTPALHRPLLAAADGARADGHGGRGVRKVARAARRAIGPAAPGETRRLRRSPPGVR